MYKHSDEKIKNTLAAVEVAFVDIKNDIDTNGKAAIGVILKRHNLPSAICGAMYRLGIVEKSKNGGGGGAVSTQYDFLTHIGARNIYDEYLSKQKSYDTKRTEKPSTKISDLPETSISFDLVNEAEPPLKKLQRHLNEAVKVKPKPEPRTFELRIFGFSLYKVIRSGL